MYVQKQTKKTKKRKECKKDLVLLETMFSALCSILKLRVDFCLKKLEKNRFQTRSFAYLDIISWIESKLSDKPMSVVINEKYIQHKKRIY
jgi:hypothetical protein